MPERTMQTLLDRALLVRRLAQADRALLGDYARWFFADRLGGARGTPQRKRHATLSLQDGQAFIRQHVGEYSPGPALDLVRRSWQRPVATDTGPSGADAQAISMAGDSSLGELVYALVRATRPAAVVETGVATGVTSAFALAALTDNDHGHLYSVDLPPTRMISAHLVGVAVPPCLHDRWTYLWGSSRRLLPGVLESVRGQVGVFVHDSDHRYEPMRWEIGRAWAALAPDAWLVVDDATLHSAVDDLAGDVGAPVTYVRQSAKPDATALLRKRSVA